MDVVLFWVKERLVGLELFLHHPLQNSVVWKHSLELLELVAESVLFLGLGVVWPVLDVDGVLRLVRLLQVLWLVAFAEHFFQNVFFLLELFLLGGLFLFLFLGLLLDVLLPLVVAAHILIMRHFVTHFHTQVSETLFDFVREFNHFSVRFFQHIQLAVVWL